MKFGNLNICKNFRMLSSRQHNFTSSNSTSSYSSDANAKFEEVKIPVPWGHIAGKWYGSLNVRPIVGIHGWQDNAGTFDTLAPLLPKHVGFLSIDLPGHGHSSWIPNGICYHSLSFVYILQLIMKEYKWHKISILAHSMGSIVGFLFASLFPNKVDMFIGIDALKPHIKADTERIENTIDMFENFMLTDQRNQTTSEPPSYLYDQLIEKLYNGTGGSVERESCEYLLKRNIKKSEKYPNKYYFVRDNRLKYLDLFYAEQETSIDLCNRITAAQMFIRFVGPRAVFYEDPKYYDEIIEILKNKSNFEFHKVEGTHHAHLNEPHKISEIINPFICKYHLVDNNELSKL